MDSITIELRTALDLKRLIQAAFPSYRRQKCYVRVFGAQGESINSYWDGGSKDEFAIVEISTGQTKRLPTSTHPYFDIARTGLAGAEDPYVKIDHVGNVMLKALPAGYALVRAGTSCGKPATACVMVNAGDLPKYLSAGPVDVRL